MDKLLENKKIMAVFISEDKESLLFLTDKGFFGYETTVDCCNTVWFEHLDNLDALIDGTVQEVQVAGYDDWNKIDGDYDDFDVLESAFWTIITNKGHCKIEVRNNHNGYYGGDVQFIEEIASLEGFKLLRDDL